MLKYSPSTFPLSFFFFRQNLVTRCILNPRHALAQIRVVSFSLFFSFLLSKTKLIALPLTHPHRPTPPRFFPGYNGLYLSPILVKFFSQMIQSGQHHLI